MWAELTGGRDRSISSLAAGGCAPKGIGISGEAKAVNGDKYFEKFSCNWAITDGISRWGAMMGLCVLTGGIQ